MNRIPSYQSLTELQRSEEEQEHAVMESAAETSCGGASSTSSSQRHSSSRCQNTMAAAETPAMVLQRMLVAEDIIRQQHDHRNLSSSPAAVLNHNPMNLVWREKVAQWCYDVADRLGEHRSIVYVAMNVLDRYCAHFATTNKAMDEKTYELASLTSLFMAVRISGSGNLKIPDLLAMSRNGIRPQDIVTTGTEMVRVLTWDHRIITPFDFAKCILSFLPPSSNSGKILDSACYLLELAVCDCAFSSSKASDIAVAAILNSMAAEFRFELNDLKHSIFVVNANIDPESETVLYLRNRLHRIYSQSYESRTASQPHVVPMDEDEHSCEYMIDEEEFRSSVAIRSISETCMCPASE